MLDTIISNFHLEKIFYIIKKRIAWMVIVGVIGGILAGGYAYLSSSTTYRAQISFYVYSDPDYMSDTSVNISSTDFSNAKSLVETYTLILKSDTVLEQVIEETGLKGYSTTALANSIGTEVVEDTAAFYVYVYDSDPANAMTIANAIGKIAPNEIIRIVKSGGVEVIDYATLPKFPYATTNIVKFVLIGFVGGFGVTLVVFLFIGLLDTTIRRRYEIKQTFNIPILGEIPDMAPSKKGEKVNKVLNEDSSFIMKESYGSIRTNMLYTGNGEKCPVYIITSADQNEGKTLNSVNVSISYSQLDKKVLLIDGDMRNISVSKQLKLKFKHGLSDYLAGLVKTPEIIKYNDNLDVISGGSVPPNPAELLAGDRMKNFIEESKNKYDCIIIDMPPVGVVTDALVLSNVVTGYLLVVRAFQSKMTREKVSVAILEQVDAEISGIIFNGINPKSGDYTYSSYQYEYKYGESEGEKAGE